MSQQVPEREQRAVSAGFPHVARLRVRYADTDAMGVVYYANYFAFFEVGRVEYLRASGADYRTIEEGGAVAAVTRADCRYRAPARFDDLLAISTRVAALGRATLRFEYEIRRQADQALLAEGYTEHACLDRQTLRPTRVPTSVRQAIEQYQPELREVTATLGNGRRRNRPVG
jgi:acyl-CoA thioester hydrolase